MNSIDLRKHFADISLDQSDQDRRGEAGRYQVQKGGLGMLETVHHKDRGQETEQVGGVGDVEVQATVLAPAVVEAQEEGNENARNHNVAQAQHGKVGGAQAIGENVLGEDQFDRGLETLSHRHHHIRSEHPEDVVDEQATEQDASSHHFVQVQHLHTVDRIRQAKQIVGDPVLLPQVPDTNHQRNDDADNVVRGELVVDEVLLLLLLALAED